MPLHIRRLGMHPGLLAHIDAAFDSDGRQIHVVDLVRLFPFNVGLLLSSVIPRYVLRTIPW